MIALAALALVASARREPSPGVTGSRATSFPRAPTPARRRSCESHTRIPRRARKSRQRTSRSRCAGIWPTATAAPRAPSGPSSPSSKPAASSGRRSRSHRDRPITRLGKRVIRWARPLRGPPPRARMPRRTRRRCQSRRSDRSGRRLRVTQGSHPAGARRGPGVVREGHPAAAGIARHVGASALEGWRCESGSSTRTSICIDAAQRPARAVLRLCPGRRRGCARCGVRTRQQRQHDQHYGQGRCPPTIHENPTVSQR